MYQKFAALISLALLAGAVCTNAQDKTGDETIKIATTLVSVPVIVSDHDGRYVPNLTATDFTVLQDGAAQNIEFFAATEEPLTIALLIDTSQSTRPVLDDIKDSAKSFIKLLKPQDRAMIVCFDYDTHILSPLTSDQEQLKRAIKSAEIPKYFGTTLRDAAYQTINRSFAGIKGRKAIILLTDGKDAGSRITTRDLLYSLQETDTLIYTIFFSTEDRPARAQQRRFPDNDRRGGGIFGGGGRFPGGGGGRFPGGGGGGRSQGGRGGERDDSRRRERVDRENQAAEEFLRQLSDTTAGRFYPSKNGKLKKTFESIVEELRFQYRIGFYPPEGSARAIHELKVKVSRPDTVVRARANYRITTQ